MRLVIRRVSGEKQATLLRRLQLEILPADTPADTKVGLWWIVLDGDKPVGFAGLHPSRRWSDVGYLCRAGVEPAYRGYGLQRRLIRVRECAARKCGYRYMVSDTYENPPSANNLIACGYKTYIPEDPWGAPGVTYWRKVL